MPINDELQQCVWPTEQTVTKPGRKEDGNTVEKGQRCCAMSIYYIDTFRLRYDVSKPLNVQLTFGVKAPARVGDTAPGTDANVFDIPINIPAYLEREKHIHCLTDLYGHANRIVSSVKKTIKSASQKRKKEEIIDKKKSSIN